jgi:hypothetical protein
MTAPVQISMEFKPRRERKERPRGFHWAQLEKSPRLQRVLRYLMDGKWHSTMDIIKGANVCAVNSAMSELGPLGNKYNYECKAFSFGTAGEHDTSTVYYYRLTPEAVERAKMFFSNITREAV